MIKNEKYTIYNAECLSAMADMAKEDIKVDLVLTDPPYGTTNAKWDSVIDFNKMWECLDKITNDNTPVLLFGSEPFTNNLINSNQKNYRYNWIWIKNNTTGFVNANRRPMKKHEIISVFYKKQCLYNPQGLVKCDKVMKSKPKGLLCNNFSQSKYVRKFTNYPNDILEFKKDSLKLHPTQKPVGLLEYLIKTYTNEQGIVLDFTMGSGSTGVASLNTGRRFIGIELDKNYYNISRMRLENIK